MNVRPYLLVVAAVCTIASSSCTSNANDLLALGEEAQRTAQSETAKTAVAEGQIGSGTRWTLALIPRNASGESLRAAGLSPDQISRVERRSPTYLDHDSAAFITLAAVAFAEWPVNAGALPRPFVVSESGRKKVSVHMVRKAHGVEVTDLTIN
jgi:hypothetical protein